MAHLNFANPNGAVLTDIQAASFLGVTRKTLANWRVSGRGPAFMKYGVVRYRLVDLEAFQRKSLRNSTSDTGVDHE